MCTSERETGRREMVTFKLDAAINVEGEDTMMRLSSECYHFNTT